MELNELKEKLKTMEIGYDDKFTYPNEIPPEQIDKILDEFGVSETLGEDWNGCDLDWSRDFKYEGMTFSAWGSGYSGSMVISREE